MLQAAQGSREHIASPAAAILAAERESHCEISIRLLLVMSNTLGRWSGEKYTMLSESPWKRNAWET